MLSMFNFLRRHREEEPHEGRREYKQMAVSPAAHARIVDLADKRGKSIIDTVDKLMGVKR